MGVTEWLVAAAALMLAGLVHGTLGIGFPLVSTPLLASVMDVRSAVLITLLPTIAVNALSILHGGRWRENVARYWPLALYALLAAVLGALLITLLDPRPFKLFLAAIILLYLNVERLRFINLRWTRTHPQLGMLVFGALAGVSAGAVNVMVPILVIFAIEQRLQRDAMVQVFNLCFMCGKLSQVLVFGAAGLLSAPLLLITAGGAGLAVLALLLGFRLRARISAETYRRLLRHMLFVMALVLVAQFFLEA